MKKESREVKEIFTNIIFRWNYLRYRLLGNMFIVNHPELKLDFPLNSEAINKLDKHYDKSINTRKLFLSDYKLSRSQKNNQETIADSMIELNKKAEDLIKGKGWSDSIKDIDLRDKESFRIVYDHCYMIVHILKKMEADVESAEAPSFALMESCFYHSQALTEKYFELVGYWTAKMEERAKKRDSGKGQKEAKEKRVIQLTEEIRKYAEDNADVLHIDKGLFIKLLSDVFVDAEAYPRHHNTIVKYKEEVERILGKKIILEKKKK